MSTDSDLEHVKRIAERAMHSEIDDFSETDNSNTLKKARAQANAYGDGERIRAYTKDDGKQNRLSEAAVMKIVNNIDSTAVSAAAMKLTQVGFIDLLREI